MRERQISTVVEFDNGPGKGAHYQVFASAYPLGLVGAWWSNKYGWLQPTTNNTRFYSRFRSLRNAQLARDAAETDIRRILSKSAVHELTQ